LGDFSMYIAVDLLFTSNKANLCLTAYSDYVVIVENACDV